MDISDISASTLVTTCAVSTVVLRLAAYLFLQWIPGHHFPPLIFSAFMIYASTFAVLALAKASYEVAATTSTVTVTNAKPRLVVASEAADDDELDVAEITAEAPSVEVTETTVYTKAAPHPLKSLLLGIPSPSNWKLSALTFGLNALLALATWDYTFRTQYFYDAKDLAFARVGYVGPSQARILLREPDAAKWPVDVWYAPNEPKSKSVALAGSVRSLSDATDYTAAITIPRLRPETEYRWFTSSNHTGTFHTPPPPDQPPKSGVFTFLHTSCIIPRFPYSPFQHPLTVRGFQLLHSRLADFKASFMLFLGDWIYIDVPRRHASSTSQYRQQYRQLYASPDWGSVGDHLPWLHVLDDHEIANDWDNGTSGVYASAIDPFTHYHASVNPPPVRPSATYYTFTWGSSASFFLLDTRSYRSPRATPDGPAKSMLGAAQRSDLLHWLRHDPAEWKFIISSVPFTRNWHYASANDTWAAYLHERATILSEAWRHPGVVVLSGDRHEFAATRFPPQGVGHDVWEFSCSPLNQFYLPVRTYQQREDSDVLVKYIPDGNSKWGVVEVDSTVPEQVVLKYRLYVDGVEKWSYVLTQEARKKGGVWT